MIQIRTLSKSFNKLQVLKDLNFTVRPGSVTGIVGPNACGKTTLMKCILGHVLPTSGEIWIAGQRAERDGRFREKIGYMPQAPIFPGNLTLRELLDMLENLRGTAAPSRERLIAYFHLQSILDRPLEHFSGGMKQRAAAVMAFMFDPPIVILDEPTVGLDPLAAVALKDLILERADAGGTIIMVSHIISEVEKLVSEMVFLNEGEIVFAGEPEDMIKKAGVPCLEKAIVRLFESREGHA